MTFLAAANAKVAYSSQLVGLQLLTPVNQLSFFSPVT